MFYSTFYSNSLCYSFKKIAPPFTSLLYNVSSNMKNIELIVFKNSYETLCKSWHGFLMFRLIMASVSGTCFSSILRKFATKICHQKYDILNNKYQLNYSDNFTLNLFFNQKQRQSYNRYSLRQLDSILTSNQK